MTTARAESAFCWDCTGIWPRQQARPGSRLPQALRIVGNPLGPGRQVWFAGLMPTAAAFRSRLVAREPLYGAWSVIPSPLSVRAAGRRGPGLRGDRPAARRGRRSRPARDDQRDPAGGGDARRPGPACAHRRHRAGVWTWAAKASSCRTSTRRPRLARWPARSGTRPPGTGQRAACWPGRSRSAWSWPSQPVRWPNSTPPWPPTASMASTSVPETCRCPWAVSSTPMTRSWTGLCSASGRPAPPRASRSGCTPPTGALARRYRGGRLYSHHDGRRRGCDHPQRRRPARPGPGLSARNRAGIPDSGAVLAES